VKSTHGEREREKERDRSKRGRKKNKWNKRGEKLCYWKVDESKILLLSYHLKAHHEGVFHEKRVHVKSLCEMMMMGPIQLFRILVGNKETLYWIEPTFVALSYLTISLINENSGSRTHKQVVYYRTECVTDLD